MKYLLIFVGSGVGGLLRFGVCAVAQRIAKGTFPLGTLVVNLVGCLLIGFLASAAFERILVREEYRIGMIVGLLGGFTTFSAFGLETFTLLHFGLYGRAAWNIFLSVGLGLLAVLLGYRIAQGVIGG